MEIRALNITPDITLSTGRVVRHTQLPNGAQNAEIIGGPEMTHEEWEEYCFICLACAGNGCPACSELGVNNIR